VLVIIPTYDERDTLPGIVRRVFDTEIAGVTMTVLVVDDASPDGTGEVADDLAAGEPRLHVLHRAGKSGLGPAYLAGFAWGLERGSDVLVEMDADGSHAPEQLPDLIAALVDADLVLGSRWIDGGEVVDWPRWREALSRGGNRYARRALKLPLADATGGYRAYRRETLHALDLTAIASQGYCFQVDLARRVVGAGLRVVEVPIRFVERQTGVSKMNRSIIAEAFWRVTLWGISARLTRHSRSDRPDKTSPSGRG
jgi:dolichol-phosphate mannosyltransferase